MAYYDPPEIDDCLSPEAEVVAEKLEAEGVSQSLIDEITMLIERLESASECRECQRRADAAATQAELDAEAAAAQYETELYAEKCPHNSILSTCQVCLAESDFAYDVARERRLH